MTELRVSWWADLFPAAETADAPRQPSFVLRRQGQPFLVLPQTAALARQGLNLYPAQRMVARLARGTLRALLRLRLPIPAARAALPLPPGNPLVRFLVGSATPAEAHHPESRPGSPRRESVEPHGAVASAPAVAVLAGNPRTPGRRFIVLAFDPAGPPAGVVKVGCEPEARRLIAREEKFLRALPVGLPGLPRLLGSLSTDRLRALKLSYAEGHNPSAGDWAGAERLLQAWVNPQETVLLGSTVPWQQLAAACASAHPGHPPPSRPADGGVPAPDAGSAASAVGPPPGGQRWLPLGGELSNALAARPVAKVVAHGDFVPWNLRVHPRTRRWTALDWERGETPGVPGWDWFHLVIQTGILTLRLPLRRLCQRVEALLAAAEFRNYAQRTGIAGVERTLVLAYLLHLLLVVRPAEGLPQTERLLEVLAQAWRHEPGTNGH